MIDGTLSAWLAIGIDVEFRPSGRLREKTCLGGEESEYQTDDCVRKTCPKGKKSEYKTD